MVDSAAVAEEILRLSPWHLEIEVTPGVSTTASPDVTSEAGPVAFYSPHRTHLWTLETVYPGGLDGRSVIDCACNCGALLFWAKELGAGHCFGFDVRDHWIKQAQFLLRHRTIGPTDDMRFEVCDLYDVPGREMARFDVTFFSGIFYHLPDPIRGLKIAADLTGELILVQTATMSGAPGDGYLAISEESRADLSGIYGLNWLPTGPRVLDRILRWLGFVETRTVQWEESSEATPGLGRLVILGSKRPGLLKAFNRRVVETLLRSIDCYSVHAFCDPAVRFASEEGTQKGIEAVTRALARANPKLNGAREDGDKFLARIESGRKRAWWLFRFSDGLIGSIQVYRDRTAALQALSAQP